ncbi:hypothetical protein WN51_10632 [Melipona quadrifasciata]|uniref:Uncharacterized protein n=1 Tax=Melipona quadrifasciata TaxID=166423 RepID=A0A0M9A8W4_9HYME|nr:hypothetical protein WN51_10632 [Melipona quadrifasciata]
MAEQRPSDQKPKGIGENRPNVNLDHSVPYELSLEGTGCSGEDGGLVASRLLRKVRNTKLVEMLQDISKYIRAAKYQKALNLKPMLELKLPVTQFTRGRTYKLIPITTYVEDMRTGYIDHLPETERNLYN